jgi:hypothetical protein
MLYNENPMPTESELSNSLEISGEDDWKEMERNELGCSEKTSCVLQLQWDWYNYCIEIRCQDTTSEVWES